MIVAQLHFGPFDGKRLLLPTEEPWPRCVVPQWEPIQVEIFYLLAGELDKNLYAYLFDDSFGGISHE